MAYQNSSTPAGDSSLPAAGSDKPKAESAASEEQRKRELFKKLRDWFELEHMRQQVNRYQMALDADYYDGDQWLPSEAAEIRRRGQNPIVFNEVKPTLDWLIGTERRTRRDFKVLARQKDKDAQKDAEVKTQLLKYLQDVNRIPFERSRAFDDAIKPGLGWIEVGVTADPEDEMIYVRAESWRNVLHDSLQATATADPRDWRYLFRFKEIDLDVAEAYFPGKEEELRRASTHGHWNGPDEDEWNGAWPTARVSGTSDVPMRWINYNPESDVHNPRDRVSLVECWYRAPTRETTGQDGSSMDRVRMQMRVAIFTKHDLLLDLDSPYRHNRFPFVPVWCYRRKADGLPYGVVRNIRGPQDDLNKRMSKAQFLMSVNQIRVEAGAIDNETMDLEELREEAAAPDGILIFKDGALSGGKVQVREGADLASGHLAMAERDQAAIRSVSGVTMENRGVSASSQSGKAIIAKQDQGSMVTAEVFDNLLFAHQLEGELTLALIEQFYREPKVFSVTGDRYKQDWHEINAVDPITGQRLNDVTAHKAAFVIGEAPWRQTLADAAFESAMNMLAQLAPVAPQVVTAIIDLVFEWADIPNKQLIVQRIRSVTNVPDPDEGESPEQQAQKQQQAQLAKAQFEAQMAQLQATIREAQGKGEKLEAEAMAKRLESLYMAAQAAQVITMAPAIAPVADELARSVGFKDQAGDGALNGAVPIAQAPQAPALPEPQQADGALMGSQAGIDSPAVTGVDPNL
jgi:hypothetical protein